MKELQEFERYLAHLGEGCVFRTNVTARFGIVTADFGIVTGRFGDVTDRSLCTRLRADADLSRGRRSVLRMTHR